MRAAVAGLVLVLCGCTTITRTEDLGAGRASGGAGTGAGVGAQSGSGLGQGASPDSGGGLVGGAGAGGGTAGGGSASSNGTASAAGSSGVSPAAGGGFGPGSSATGCSKPVKIGISYSSDEGAGLAAVGNPSEASQFSSYAQVQEQLYQLSADDANRKGGFAGCKVVLGFHDFKALGADGFSGESQTECTDFAEDQHVFAVINTVLENKTLSTCLAQHHVVDLYYSETYQPTPADYAAYRGYLYEPDGLGPYRWGPYIKMLAAVGFLAKGVKVGILVADDGTGTNQHLVNDIWKPELEGMGITPVIFTYHQIEGYSDVSSTTSQFSSAVLQFRSAGVDHVIDTPDNGDMTIFFTQVAHSQGYHPRYALSTASGVAAWPTEPSDQRPNAIDISWSFLDLGGAPDPRQVATNPPSASRTACDSLYRGHTGSNPTSSYYQVCDAFNFLRLALRGATEVTPATLLAGVDHLGGGLQLADGFGYASFNAPGKYDGQPAVRLMQWDEPDQVWKYVTPPEAVP